MEIVNQSLRPFCFLCGQLELWDDLTEACVDGVWRAVCWSCRDSYSDESLADILSGDSCKDLKEFMDMCDDDSCNNRWCQCYNDHGA